MVYVEELLLLPDSEKPTVSVVEIPPSVKIIDYTKRPVTQGPETVTSSHVTPARRTALLLINGLVLVCALGLWVFRSCRRKRS